MWARDPLDDLELPESPREPRTPWMWMIVALIVAAVVLWLILAQTNQPAPGGIVEGRLLHHPAEGVGHVNGRGRGVVVEQAPAFGSLPEEVGGLGHG